MQKYIDNPIVSILARVILGGMFILAGMGKIADPSQFAKEIANYDILPLLFINISAIALPWIEVVIGIFLIAGLRLRANATITGLMLIVFIVAVGIAMIKGLDINCGCHSQMIDQKVGFTKIAENSGLLIAALQIYFFPSSKISIEHYIKN
jgi:putative oxidoreductase